MRYRLQRKQTVARPNILGNHSFPVYTWEWRDVAVSNSKKALEQYMKDHALGAEYKIIDTREAVSDESNTDF